MKTREKRQFLGELGEIRGFYRYPQSYENLQVSLQNFQARKFFCVAVKFIDFSVLPCKIIGQDFLGLFDSDLIPIRYDIHDRFFYVVDFEGILVFADSLLAKGVPFTRKVVQ